MITSRVPIPADRVESALSVRRAGAPRRTHSCARGLKSTVCFGMFGVFATPAMRLQLSPLRTRRERASCSSRIDASAKRRGSVAGPVDGVDAPPAFPRRAALAGVLSAAFIAPATPAIAGNPFSDFADAQLASKARLFMGPLQLTSDRLAELRAAESNLSVEDLAQTLGAATLDCMNPRGPLAAYANVRDVCTLKILLRSATEGPAVRNAPDSPLSIAAASSFLALQESYDALAVELARSPEEGSRDAAFGECTARLRAFADALLACFRLDSEVSDDIRGNFPELFPR